MQPANDQSTTQDTSGPGGISGVMTLKEDDLISIIDVLDKVADQIEQQLYCDTTDLRPESVKITAHVNAMSEVYLRAAAAQISTYKIPVQAFEDLFSIMLGKVMAGFPPHTRRPVLAKISEMAIMRANDMTALGPEPAEH
ncbi:MAG: hypothetical protein MRY72_02100 [Aquisalinus sp.]|nr:hypothetical protein [Aquisalinus sp.]